jgi:lysophospholipase L1-like esterase
MGDGVTMSAGATRPLVGTRRLVATMVVSALVAGVAMLADPGSALADYSGPPTGPRVGVVGDSQVAISTFSGDMVPAHVNRGMRVDSRGHVGHTVAQTRAEIDRVLATEPDVMVVALATNDAYYLSQASQASAESRYAAALGQIGEVMGQMSTRPCGVWVMPRVAVTNRGHARWADRLTDDIRRLARRHRLRVVDWDAISAGRTDWFIWDGVHFTRAGSRAFAEAVADETSRCFAQVSSLRRVDTFGSTVSVLGRTICRNPTGARLETRETIGCGPPSFVAVERVNLTLA